MSIDSTFVEDLISPGYGRQLLAEGLARNLIWSNGQLPEDAPRFRANLSSGLIDYAFGLLSTAIRMRSERENQELTLRAFEASAQALESVVRDGDANNLNGFLTIIAAASYHLAHLNARAFILVNESLPNLSPTEVLFRELILRRFSVAKTICRQYLTANDRALQQVLISGNIDGVSARALTANYFRAIAALLAFFSTGDLSHLDVARSRLAKGIAVSGDWGFVEAWWLSRLTFLMLDDFQNQSYHAVLPRPEGPVGRLRDALIDHLANKKTAEVDLWPSQVGAAVRAFDEDDDLVMALPTSSGKTRIADLCMVATLAGGRDVIYVTPLRALSAQVERDVRALYGDLGFTVSSLYDVGTPGKNGQSVDQIRISTPEKLDFALRKDPSVLDNVGLIIFDEAHLIGTSPREIRYEQLIDRILRVKVDLRIRFVCLSALLPAAEDISTFTKWIRNGAEGNPIRSEWRPTRQTFGSIMWKGDHARLDLTVGDQTPFVEHFVDQQVPRGQLRQKNFPKNDRELVLASAFKFAGLGESVLIYCPLKQSVKADSRDLIGLVKRGYLTLPQFDAEQFFRPAEMVTLHEWLGAKHPVTQCLKMGIAIHHGDLPTAVLAIVERMIQTRASRIIIASPSIAQGINISASVVIFRNLRRFVAGAQYADLIPVEEFRNVIGRAGRAFVDIGGQILYCYGMDAAKVESRKRDWQDLQNLATERRLESGLLALIGGLLKRLGPISDASVDFLASHANIDMSMNGEPLQGPESYDRDLDALDDAVLTLIRDEDIPLQALAATIDQMLQGSLLARTLETRQARVHDVIYRVLVGRAESLLTRFTPRQRRAAFLSGVRARLMDSFDQLVKSVREDILALEQSLNDDKMILDTRRLASVCERLLEFPQFQYTGERAQVGDRNAIIAKWISGAAMRSLIEQDENALTFVEEAVKYSAVWALEAVRNAMDDRLPNLTLTSLVSFGLNSSNAIDLVRSRLESRTAATKLASLIPTYLSFEARNQWLIENAGKLRTVLDVDEQIAFDTFIERLIVREANDLPSIGIIEFEKVGESPSTDLVFVFPTGDGGFEATDRDLSVFAVGTLPPGVKLRTGGEVGSIKGQSISLRRPLWSGI